MTVTESTNEFIKVVENVPGAFKLLAGQRIRGFNSGNIATINTISENTGQFEISYSLRQDQGWKDNIVKLNQDFNYYLIMIIIKTYHILLKVQYCMKI